MTDTLTAEEKRILQECRDDGWQSTAMMPPRVLAGLLERGFLARRKMGCCPDYIGITPAGRDALER